MKKIFLLIGLLFFFSVSAQAGLIALYQFDNSTNLGLDTSGNNVTATNSNAVYNAAGFTGGAASFNGSNAFLGVPLNLNVSVMPNMTWGAWVKASNVNPVRAVLSTDNGGFDRQIDLDSRGGGIRWSTFTGTGVIGSGSAPVSGQWYFLAVVYQQSINKLTLYVDNLSPVVNASTSFGTSQTFFNIGRNSMGSEYFSGLIDNVFVYNEALTGTQIDAIRSNAFQTVDEPPMLLLFFMAALAGFASPNRRAQVGRPTWSK